MTTRSIAPGIWSIEVPLPPDTLPILTRCYVFAADGGIDLVDPGWHTDEARQQLEEGLAGLGFGLDAVRTVAATHRHDDHVGQAGRVRDRSGAMVALGRADAVELPFEIDVLLDDGDEIVLGGYRVVAVATPGHTPGSMSFDVPDAGLLLTGDTVLPIINPGIGLGLGGAANPIRDYLASLERIAVGFGDRVGLPGHGDPIEDLAGRARELAAHHRQRTDAVAAALREHPGATPAELAPHLTWTGGWENLGPLQESAVRQTGWHLDLVADRGVATEPADS